jgi:CzcA family heavy metal efflux pump
MMRWIVGTSLKFRFLIVAGAAGMLFFGVGQLREMPVDVFPEFAPPRVEIQTACLGLTAAEVEELITVPLEQALQGVPGLDVMRSKSVGQLSSIEMIFETGTDLLDARQVVQERVATVTPTLPSWAAPPVMIQPLSATSRTMKIGLSSDELSLIDLSSIARWKIRDRLLQVPGVANIAIWGHRQQQLQVLVDPEHLRKVGVSLDQVQKVTGDAFDRGLLTFSDGAIVGTGGFIDTPNQRLGVRHILPIVTPEDLAQVPVAKRNGKILRMDEVGRVVLGHQPLIGDAVINDGPGLLLIVEKFPWANTVDVTLGVESALDALKPGLPNVEIDSSIFRPATFVEMAIQNLSRALFLGALLMVLVLVAFLYDWRSALISVVTIPLSLMAAGLVLHQRGVTVNTMVLAGLLIALGAIVDDAIVGVENIVRRLREHRKQGSDKSIAKVIFDASLEVRSAIVFASAIEALALLPIFFLEGLTGSFFRPLAYAYALAVVVSTGMALIVTPALSMILFSSAPLSRREPPLMGWLQRGYEKMLARIVRTPRPAFVTVGALVLTGVLVMPLLGQSLLPSFKERDFLMHWLTKPGTSLPEEKRITTRSSRELRAVPGVRNFGSHIGQALRSDEVVDVDFGENWISVDPEADYDATVASIQEVVDGYPGLFRDVLTYLKERIREVLTGTSDAIVVRIFGDDLDVLRRKAEEVRQELSGVPGMVELHVELQEEIPQVDVKVDLAAAQRHGVKPGDVRRAAATYMAGLEVGDFYYSGKTWDVNVRAIPEKRRDLSDVRALLIDTPDGGHVALGDLARVQIAPTPNVIFREDVSRRIDISANVRGRDLGSVVADVDETLAGIDFPLEYHAEVLGEWAERQAAQQRLLLLAGVASFGILLLLLVSFKSWRLAILSFVTLPIALVGGVLAAYFGGGIISLGSLVGFFTVLGIVARNGIMQISHYQHLENHEGETFGPQLVVRGSRERLAPILMTALTTGLALVPLVITGDIPGQEIEYPMGLVILGGLVTSTLLNLFVVPSLYLRFGRPRGAGDAPQAAAA